MSITTETCAGLSIGSIVPFRGADWAVGGIRVVTAPKSSWRASFSSEIINPAVDRTSDSHSTPWIDGSLLRRPRTLPLLLRQCSAPHLAE